MTEPSIHELSTPEEMREALPVLLELRPHLTPATYEALLARMQPSGYRLFAVRSGGGIVALAGVGFGTNLYYGSYLWVYDLVTTARARSEGHGKALLDHLERLAQAAGCDTIALSSGIQRLDAHRFYEDKAGFGKASYTFSKHLKGTPFMPSADLSSDQGDGPQPDR